MLARRRRPFRVRLWGRGGATDFVFAQDDNASGHGITRNQKTHLLVHNETRLQLEANLLKRHIKLVTQGAQGPEQNKNDLGVLNMVARKNRRKWRQVRKATTAAGKIYALFGTIHETFWDDALVQPYKIFNISQMKQELLLQTIQNKGECR